jgi:hypothetical protein
MNQPSIDLIASFFAEHIRPGASSSQIARSVAAACRGIEAALAPVIGRRGVAALLGRSLHLTARTHGWIEGMTEGSQSDIDVEGFESSIARQTGADAAAGGQLFLSTFNNLRVSLIGPPLSWRFLRPVWTSSLSGTTPQDPTP